MRKPILLVFSLLVFGAASLAQTKVETKWHCAKPAVEHHLDIGDMPDHTYALVQGDCTATSTSKAWAEKSGQFNEVREAWKESNKAHGYYNATMENGDKVYYTYEASGSNDMSKPISNRWKIVGGTGAHKGAKGSGGCSGKQMADQSADLTCTGAVSMGKKSETSMGKKSEM